MKSAEVEECGKALWEKRITQDAFLRATTPYWRPFAAVLWRRWRRRLPASVEYEDIEQEFLMRVAAFVPDWDPARGQPLVKFLVYAATKRTQRAIHKMRGARIHGNEGKNASHVEVNFTKYASKRERDGETADFDPCDLVPVFATQDAAAAVREILSDALHDATTIREAFVMLALRESGGDPDDAAVKLFESFSARVECGFRDVEQARRVVGATVSQVVGQYIDAA